MKNQKTQLTEIQQQEFESSTKKLLEFHEQLKCDTPIEKRLRTIDVTLENRGRNIFDETSGILFWDDINNNLYSDRQKEMEKRFWRPEEVSMTGDVNDWATKMSTEERELLKTAISILASLDSIAGVYDYQVFMTVKDTALRHILIFLAMQECIHNRSYTYILSSIMPLEESKEVFEIAKKNPYVVKRNEAIFKHFDNYINNSTPLNFVKGQIAMASLEGLCFVNGFVPFYYLNENGKMMGAGECINFINRDENLHTDLQTITVRDVVQQFPEISAKQDILLEKSQLDDLSEEQYGSFVDWIYSFLRQIVHLESQYCVELYKDTPMIEFEKVVLYIGYRANMILDQLGLDMIFKAKTNPMSWIKAHDPEFINQQKTDHFEGKERNYATQEMGNNGWDDL